MAKPSLSALPARLDTTLERQVRLGQGGPVMLIWIADMIPAATQHFTTDQDFWVALTLDPTYACATLLETSLPHGVKAYAMSPT